MKFGTPKGEVEIDLESTKRQLWFCNELAKPLDRLVAEIKALHGADCLKETVAPVLKELLTEKDISVLKCKLNLAHVKGHVEICSRVRRNWQDLWDFFGWKAVAGVTSLATTFTAARHTPGILADTELDHALKDVPYQVLQLTVIMEEAKANPQRWHWNTRPKDPFPSQDLINEWGHNLAPKVIDRLNDLAYRNSRVP